MIEDKNIILNNGTICFTTNDTPEDFQELGKASSVEMTVDEEFEDYGDVCNHYFCGKELSFEFKLPKKIIWYRKKKDKRYLPYPKKIYNSVFEWLVEQTIKEHKKRKIKQ